MKRDELIMELMPDGNYQTVFRNNHGRKIYMQIKRDDEFIKIIECIYIDRPVQLGKYKRPKRFASKICKTEELLSVTKSELDKQFYGMSFSDELIMDRDEYIKSKLELKKYKFLIFVKEGDTIKTRLKSQVRREIYLEIKLISKQKACIIDCYYFDREQTRKVTPVGLNTILFCPTNENFLRIVNEELSCNFTNIIYTEDTFGFNEKNIPICGSI